MGRHRQLDSVAADLFRPPLRRDGSTLLHDQIVDRVVTLIEEGRLRRGAYLPAIKFTAAKLSVSHGTVSRAYEILAARGLVAASSTRGVELLVGAEPDGTRAPRLWAPLIMQPSLPGDHLAATPMPRTRATDAQLDVRFGVSECGGDLVPGAMIAQAIAEAAPRGLSYPPPSTALPECDAAVRAYLERRGVPLRGAAVFVTSGTTQSLAIIARALGRPGGVVLTEHPTWHVALSVFSAAGLRVVGVPVDNDGLQTEALADIVLRHAPAFLYLQPAFQNPTGLTLTPTRRRQLLEVARRLHVPVVEDDFASELAFGIAPRPLRTPEAEDVVIYLKSFAKLLTPALRVGVIVAPPRYERVLRETQHGLDPFVSVLAQRMVAACLATDAFELHLARVARELSDRATALLTALERHMPPGSHWTTPRGGLCAWVEFPPPVRTFDFVGKLAERGVTLSAGRQFCLESAGDHSARLAFGNTPIRDQHGRNLIDLGIQVLAETVREHLKPRQVWAAVQRAPAP